MKRKKGKHIKRSRKKLLIITLIIILLLITIFIFNMIYFKNQKKEMKSIVDKYFNDNKLTQEIGNKKIEYKNNLNKSYYIIYPKFNKSSIDKNIEKILSNIKKQSTKNIGTGIKELFSKNHIYNIINYESFLAPDGIISISFINTKINSKGKIISETVDTINLSILEEEKLKDTYIFIKGYKNDLTKYVKTYISNNKKIKERIKNSIKEKMAYKYILTKDKLNIYFSSDILNNNKSLKISIPFTEIENMLNIDINNIIELKNIKKDKEKFTDNNKKMYIKRISNIYLKDSKNSKVIGTIDKGKKVNIKKTSKNYSIVKYKGKEGYILNIYLSDEIISDKGFTDVKETVYASEDIVIKKGMNDTDEELVTLSLGDSITRIGTSENGYSEVVYNEKKGYVKSNYLSLVKPITNRYYKIDKNKNINIQGGMVALTFDDGPNPSSTGRILDVFEKNHAVATFFDLGKLVQSYPDVVKREETIGCEVGSHTYDHQNLNNLSSESIQEQMTKSKNAFISVLGHDVQLLRPPYGNANELVKANIPYPIINWNVDTLDWKSKNKDAILNEIRKIGNLDGKIILMHSIYDTTADAVEIIVPELINQGYQLVTISELAYYKGATLSPGEKFFGF